MLAELCAKVNEMPYDSQEEKAAWASSVDAGGEAPLPVVVGEPLGEASTLMGTPGGEAPEEGATRVLDTTPSVLRQQALQ